jgi:hypothetical protein
MPVSPRRLKINSQRLWQPNQRWSPWHCAEAGLVEKAVVYWLKAGQQAWARSAMTEAAAQLQRG